MGLYLCIFDSESEDELDGVEVGSYDDFGQFRELVLELVEEGEIGSRCPVLMLHSDCDGVWSSDESRDLLEEIQLIYNTFSSYEALELPEGWKREVAAKNNISPHTLADCFFDVDGMPLLVRLRELAETSVRTGFPISFQ